MLSHELPGQAVLELGGGRARQDGPGPVMSRSASYTNKGQWRPLKPDPLHGLESLRVSLPRQPPGISVACEVPTSAQAQPSLSSFVASRGIIRHLPSAIVVNGRFQALIRGFLEWRMPRESVPLAVVRTAVQEEAVISTGQRGARPC